MAKESAFVKRANEQILGIERKIAENREEFSKLIAERNAFLKSIEWYNNIAKKARSSGGKTKSNTNNS